MRAAAPSLVASLFLGLAWSGSAAPAAAPDAWVLEGGAGVPCTLEMVWAAGGRVVKSDTLEPGCNLSSIAFAGDEAIVLFKSASGPAAVWRVSARSTARLTPPVEIVTAVGAHDGKLTVLGYDAEEAYSKARATIAVIVPGDPGCRPAVAKALTIDAAGTWTVRERVEGTCSSAPGLVQVPAEVQSSAMAAAARVSVHGIRGQALLELPQRIRDLPPGESWWLSEPPVVAWRSSREGSVVAMLDAPGKPVLTMPGLDPITSDRDGVRLLTTGTLSAETALVVRIADGKPLFVSGNAIGAGFWGVPSVVEEGW